jgi:translocation and assembly module TamA
MNTSFRQLYLLAVFLAFHLISNYSYALIWNKSETVIINAPGLEDAAIKNARLYLKLASETCDSPRWKVNKLYSQVERQIGQGLRAFGYYQPAIKKKMEVSDKCWQVKIDIDAGEPVKIKRIDIKVSGASDDEQINKTINSFKPLIGKQLLHKQYEGIKSRLIDRSYERGYIDAGFEKSELRVDPKNHSAEIIISLKTGERYYIGELNIDQEILDEDFLVRLADTQVGVPLESETLIRLQRNLSDSGYFSAVDIMMQRDKVENQKMPFAVRLKPRKKHAWKAGIGVETDIGVRYTGGYENRIFNRHGHQWGGKIELSKVESEIKTDYMIPGRNPHKEKFNFGMSLKHEDVDTYDSDTVTILASQTLKKSPRWTEIRSLELLYEDYKVADESDDDILFMPGIAWQYKRVDNPFKVHFGYRFGLSVKGAVEGLISTQSLLQTKINGKIIYRPGDAGRFSARGEFGTTLVDDIDDVPASLRFFAGGDNSVRGYDYESLGPEDDNGEVVGGTELITASLEYEHPVKNDDWWVSTFVDAGNAFDFDDHDVKLKIGYGVGVRWFSSFGRFKLDFAVPEETGLDDWKVHFSFGTEL